MKTIKEKVNLYELLKQYPLTTESIDDIVYEYARKIAEKNSVDFDLCGFSQKITVKIEMWEDKDTE